MAAPEANRVSEGVSEGCIMAHATGQRPLFLSNSATHLFRSHQVRIYILDMENRRRAPMPNMFHFREATACAFDSLPHCVIHLWDNPNSPSIAS